MNDEKFIVTFTKKTTMPPLQNNNYMHIANNKLGYFFPFVPSIFLAPLFNNDAFSAVVFRNILRWQTQKQK